MTFSDVFSTGVLCRIRLYWEMGLYWGLPTGLCQLLAGPCRLCT